MGFNNIVISRIDYKEKEIRKKNQTMEFIWKPFSQIENVKTEIFTHIQYDGYCMPGDLGFLINDKDINKTDSEIAVISEKFLFRMFPLAESVMLFPAMIEPLLEIFPALEVMLISLAA